MKLPEDPAQFPLDQVRREKQSVPLADLLPAEVPGKGVHILKEEAVDAQKMGHGEPPPHGGLEQDQLLHRHELLLRLLEFRFVPDIQLVFQHVAVWVAVDGLHRGVDIVSGEHGLSSLFVLGPELLEDLLIAGLAAGNAV